MAALSIPEIITYPFLLNCYRQNSWLVTKTLKVLHCSDRAFMYNHKGHILQYENNLPFKSICFVL